MKKAAILFGSSVLIVGAILLLTENAQEPTAANNIEFEIKLSETKKSNLRASEYGGQQATPHENTLNRIPGEQKKRPEGKPEISLEDHLGSLETEQTEIVESAEELYGSLPAEAAIESMHPLDSFNSEPVDIYRAGNMERSYIDLFSSDPLLADFALTEANCKSEYCRISVAVTDEDQTIRLINALASSFLEKYGKIDLQIGSYNENGLVKFYIRSVSPDEPGDGQKGL